jgi:hypothetical protein
LFRLKDLKGSKTSCKKISVFKSRTCEIIRIRPKEYKLALQRYPKFHPTLIFATVKIFAFIFAFYILFLSAVPCCAMDCCKDEAQQTQATHQHKQNDGCNHCSPFNQCGNCVGFAFSIKTFQIDTPPQQAQQIFSGFIQTYCNQYISSFWQPPRLG